MSPSTHLERDLTAWLSETAMPHTPDYADEILDETARIRQRPRWTFARRWLPIPEVHVVSPVRGQTLLTGISLLVILGLILAALVAFVGGRRALPPPFGLAGNGLLVASVAGDIVLVDSETMGARSIVAGAALDRDPHWALDGTRFAFLRETGDRQAVIVADVDGRVLSVTEPFSQIDSDSIAWSPDGRQIAIGADRGRTRVIYVIEAASGRARDVGVVYGGFEVYWRPPDGRQLLFRAADAGGGLAVVSVADDAVVRVPTGNDEMSDLRPLGWTPDGRSVLFQHDEGDLPRTIVVEMDTGAQVALDVGFGHVSNDGTRVAGASGLEQLCVSAITGGACEVLGNGIHVEGPHGASVVWSPDDRWIATGVNPVRLVDPSNLVPPRVISFGGPGSWQRIAP